MRAKEVISENHLRLQRRLQQRQTLFVADFHVLGLPPADADDAEEDGGRDELAADDYVVLVNGNLLDLPAQIITWHPQISFP